MFEEFKENVNLYLNYEYVLLDVVRNYNIGFVKIDDFVWGDVDIIKEYEKIKNYFYLIIRRREFSYEINNIKFIVCEVLKVEDGDIIEVILVGGMINKNYRICVKGIRYILRVVGVGIS